MDKKEIVRYECDSYTDDIWSTSKSTQEPAKTKKNDKEYEKTEEQLIELKNWSYLSLNCWDHMKYFEGLCMCLRDDRCRKFTAELSRSNPDVCTFDASHVDHDNGHCLAVISTIYSVV